MKRLVIIMSLGIALVAGNTAMAQSFSMAHDTVWVTAGAGMTESHSDITNAAASAITIEWKVINTDFPADWVENTGICDNNSCYSGSGLWPTTMYECIYPASTAPGTFKMQIDVSGTASAGPHFMKVRVNNKFAVNDTAYVTFVVTKAPAIVSAVKAQSEVTLYPNPATSVINLTYDAAADVKNIAVYNIIGKQVSVYRSKGSTGASFGIEGLPSGIYFVRLINSKGDIVITRKFTKQ